MAAGPATFAVSVPDIGTFIFRRRALRQQLAIEVEYSRLTEGFPAVTEFTGRVSAALADLKVLTVEAPAGWDAEELDGLDDEGYDQLMAVWGALRDKETTFRTSVQAPSQDVGEGSGGDVRPAVPAPVQPGAD